MRVMEDSPEIQRLARRLVESQERPPSIKRAQKNAWGQVKRLQTLFLKAAVRLDRAMLSAESVMRQSSEWEREHRELKEELIREAERARDRASLKEMEAIKKIRRQVTNQFQENVQRVPELRRVLSRSRSRPPTPLGS